MPEVPSVLELAGRLAQVSTRPAAAAMLASRLGVDGLLLFATDPSLGMLIPAAGMPQTLRGGKSLRSFIAQLPATGRMTGTVELPVGKQQAAQAVVNGGAAVILIGGEAAELDIESVESVLPLLSGLFNAELMIVLARADAAAARAEVGRAGTLADALENARADAAALNAALRNEQRRKDEFLAMLGHELRNPLAPLVNAIALLRMQGPDRPAQPKLLDVMGRQIAQLTRLVEDLLDMSRVSSGRIALQCERLALGDAVADALESSRVSIEARRHKLVMHNPGPPLEIDGDQVRLVQVFSNLLNNAAKYTDPGGTITVTLSRAGSEAAVRVADTGIGIAPDVLPKIFDLFAQAPVALSRAQGGLGIGLTLVKTLVELHGGRVDVESDGLGQGSTFSVFMPLARPAHGPALRGTTEVASTAAELAALNKRLPQSHRI